MIGCFAKYKHISSSIYFLVTGVLFFKIEASCIVLEMCRNVLEPWRNIVSKNICDII